MSSAFDSGVPRFAICQIIELAMPVSSGLVERSISSAICMPSGAPFWSSCCITCILTPGFWRAAASSADFV